MLRDRGNKITLGEEAARKYPAHISHPKTELRAIKNERAQRREHGKITNDCCQNANSCQKGELANRFDKTTGHLHSLSWIKRLLQSRCMSMAARHFKNLFTGRLFYFGLTMFVRDLMGRLTNHPPLRRICPMPNWFLSKLKIDI